MAAEIQSPPAPVAPTKKRLVWMDVAKGIGIILVVIGHVERGLVNANLLSNTATVETLDLAIYAFHMPLFFFLSGLVVQRSLSKGRYPFFLSKIQTILYPYLLWSLIQGSIQVLLSSDANDPITTSDLWAIGWKPYGQFWFLYALMGCHMLLAALPLNRPLLIALCLLAAVLFRMPGVRELEPFSLMLYGLVFYLPGVLLTEKLGERLTNRWIIVLGSAVLFTMAYLFSRYLTAHGVWGIGTVIAASLGIWMTLSLSNVLKGGLQHILAIVGTMSMSIYVMHVLAGAGIRIVLSKLGIRDPMIHLSAGVIVGVVGPMIAHQILSRLKMLHYFGLGPAPRRTAPQVLPTTS